MTAITSDDLARQWARRLETQEASHFGVSLGVARRRVASRIGVAGGTLENLSRQRIKGVRESVFTALRAAIIKQLQHEVAAHSHELAVLVASDRGADSRTVSEVEAGLSRLKALLTDEATKPTINEG